MDKIQIYKVYPAIPDALEFLDYLARNLWWSWNHEAVELFRRINPQLWVESGSNPVAFLSRISQRRFDELARDESFIGHLNRVKFLFEQMLSVMPKIQDVGLDPKETIAYFSMEFGLHESLPFFAGGLGILAGDHLKASSSLGLPLTGVGLLFSEGYFRQYLDHDGWQQETYPKADVFDLPVQKVKNADGYDIMIEISGPETPIKACVWQVRIGCVRLLLLDANIHENPPEIRHITSRLYMADERIRVAQEILLGIGGMMALHAMGIFPSVCHLNEGHCAFAGLERLNLIMDRFDIDFESAQQICRRTGIFTTHTPVPAGHDEFHTDVLLPFLKPYAEKYSTSVSHILSWGRPAGVKTQEKFSMFSLGVRFSGFINGVSQLHGRVARAMWTDIWPGRHVEEIPISHVTNGVHIQSYISHQKDRLFERYVASEWGNRLDNFDLISRIDNIEDTNLWHVHELDRSRLIKKCREALLFQYERRNAPRNILDDVVTVLDHNVLTICFARRFATYKRAGLLFRDPERLKRMILSADQPVQFVFAGKAHPNDHEGKDIIRRIVAFAQEKTVRHRVVFLEDYDISIARHMVQGCDVWLNTPRRPNEACGTSGMKAAINGGLNLSILDGWWCEGYHESRGWAIGKGDVHEDQEYQDRVESQALYNLLEDEVIPCFYERKRGNPPARWIRMMKETMKMAIKNYSSDRMVREYTSRFYIPSVHNLKSLTEESAVKARELALTQKRLEALWKEIRLYPPELSTDGEFLVGDTFRVTLKVYLGELSPEEVTVEIYHGRFKSSDRMEGSRAEAMWLQETIDESTYVYACTITCTDSGRFGCTARVIPSGDDIMKLTPGLITWV